MQTYTTLIQIYHPMSDRPQTISYGYVIASSLENAREAGIVRYGKSFVKVLGELNN